MYQPQELLLFPYPVPLSGFNVADAENKLIIACPNPPAEAVEAGLAVSIPKREFDIDVVLNQLPSGFSPDLVHMSARNMRFRPRGLEKLKCPKVMKIGDTFHWGDGLLSQILDYCRFYQCDYHWTYQGVQHLHFFIEAGLKNVFWLPGTPVIPHYVPPKAEEKIYDVVFRGSQSALHLQRGRLLNTLQTIGINIDVQSKPYNECLEDYTKSHIVLNCSLNGDCNRRVFETLMAGGFLLTDRLSPESGLSSLFQEGVHLECYGSEAELVEKINFYLSHPEKAAQIAEAGQQKLLSDYSQTAIQEKLYRYVQTGEIEAPFKLEHEKRVVYLSAKDSEAVNSRVKIYELIQEIHRSNSRVKLVYWQGNNRELLADLADLPRLEITYVNTPTELTNLQMWCSKVGVCDRITWQPLMPDPVLPPQIVMIDQPSTALEVQTLAANMGKWLTEAEFLLIVQPDQSSQFRMQRSLRQRSLRLQGFTPIHLAVPNPHPEVSSLMELGTGVELYQRSSSSYSQPVQELVVNKLSKAAKLRQELYQLPLVNQVKQLVRQR